MLHGKDTEANCFVVLINNRAKFSTGGSFKVVAYGTVNGDKSFAAFAGDGNGVKREKKPGD